jgi:hypothetical protein
MRAKPQTIVEKGWPIPQVEWSRRTQDETESQVNVPIVIGGGACMLTADICGGSG